MVSLFCTESRLTVAETHLIAKIGSTSLELLLHCSKFRFDYTLENIDSYSIYIREAVSMYLTSVQNQSLGFNLRIINIF